MTSIRELQKLSRVNDKLNSLNRYHLQFVATGTENNLSLVWSKQPNQHNQRSEVSAGGEEVWVNLHGLVKDFHALEEVHLENMRLQDESRHQQQLLRHQSHLLNDFMERPLKKTVPPVRKTRLGWELVAENKRLRTQNEELAATNLRLVQETSRLRNQLKSVGENDLNNRASNDLGTREAVLQRAGVDPVEELVRSVCSVCSGVCSGVCSVCFAPGKRGSTTASSAGQGEAHCSQCCCGSCGVRGYDVLFAGIAVVLMASSWIAQRIDGAPTDATELAGSTESLISVIVGFVILLLIVLKVVYSAAMSQRIHAGRRPSRSGLTTQQGEQSAQTSRWGGDGLGDGSIGNKKSAQHRVGGKRWTTTSDYSFDGGASPQAGQLPPILFEEVHRSVQ
jgi:hypothetical protein